MNIIKRFYVKQMVKQIDKSIKVKFGKCLQCEPTENTIYVNNKTDIIDIVTFRDYVKELNSKCKFNTLLLGILHEIGHIYTYTRFNEIKYNFCTTLIKEIQAKHTNPKYLNFFYNCYFNLKLERLADKWAMDFIKNNQELVDQWQIMLQENYNKVMPKFINHMKIKYHKDLLN